MRPDQLPNLYSFHIMSPPVPVKVPGTDLGTDDDFHISTQVTVTIKTSKFLSSFNKHFQ